MSAPFEEIQSLIAAGDFESALSLIAIIAEKDGNSPRLLVLKASCLQLSNDAALSDIERTLLQAVEIDDEYVPAYLELGWFKLNVQDDLDGAKDAFDRARDLLKKMTAEAFRGLLVCAQELRPSQNLSKFKSEFERDLVEDLNYDVRRERPAG